MNAAEQVRNEGERLQRLIAHWCPPDCKEVFPISLLRAFMGVTACAAEQGRLMAGKPVIRPVSSFPDPLFGFDFTEDKRHGFSTPPREHEELQKTYHPIQIINAMLKALPNDEERIQAMEGICRHCGAILNGQCYCRADD